MKNKTKVVSISLFISVFIIFVSCGPKQDKVEKYTEEGEEVIVNHLDPYKIKGKLISMNLKEELVIDMESVEIQETGLTDVDYFDIDSEGNIYIVNVEPKERLVFKFDRNGSFKSYFGRKGQGPGEIQFVLYFVIDNQDNIIISDHVNRKIVIYGLDGKFVKEIPYDLKFFSMFPLENSKYLFLQNVVDTASKSASKNLRICDSDYEKIKELDACHFTSPFKGKGWNPLNPVYVWRVSSGNIYAGNEQRNYEILMYDLEGNLLRKIKKEYTPVKFPNELKEKYIKAYGRARRLYFPEYRPPFQFGFADEKGHLFVMTYEKGENPKEYKYDIFNADSIFISRTNLGNVGKPWIFDVPLDVMCKKELLYCVRQKESGYQELAVYKMKWE